MSSKNLPGANFNRVIAFYDPGPEGVKYTDVFHILPTGQYFYFPLIATKPFLLMAMGQMRSPNEFEKFAGSKF